MIVLNEQWLPHLSNVIPQRAYGDNLSMYTIALEGWRRGLNLKFYSSHTDEEIGIHFSLKNKDREHYFQYTKDDKLPKETVTIGKDVIVSKSYLQDAFLPIIEGKTFDKNTRIEEVLTFVKEIGYPVALKTTNNNFENKIFSIIKKEEDLLDSFKLLIDQNREILIEKYVSGESYRLFVMNNEVLGVIQRVPANIVGDGIHTIKELVKNKNTERKNNPYLNDKPLKVDDDMIADLEIKGYSLKTVLDKGEQIIFEQKRSFSHGGEPVDVTETFSDKLKEIALKAVKAIPGLAHCGVDMIVDPNENGYITGINTNPDIGSHLYPVKGTAKDIPSAIIDYYFPETIGNRDDNFYFDFTQVFDVLRKGLLNEITLSNKPTDSEFESFEVYGDVQSNRFHNWLMKQTMNLYLNGYAETKADGTKHIVVCGKETNVGKFTKLLQQHVPVRTTKRYGIPKQPLKSGFEIID